MNGSADHGRSQELAKKRNVISTFEEYRSELDGMNERRERLIVASRQITSLSKKLIFHLHRISLFPESVESNKSERRKILEQSEEKIQEIREWVGNVAEELKKGEVGYWAHARNISPGIQEYIEGISFLHYLRHHSLITLDQVRQTLKDEQGKEMVEIVNEDYALGISDLSGELMRYATNCSSTGDFKAALEACTFVRELKDGQSPITYPTVCALLRQLQAGLDSALPFVRDLAKKQSITEQSLLKIEKVCYAIQLRMMEYGDRPEVLEYLAKRAMEDAQDPMEGEAMADGNGIDGNSGDRSQQGSRGRGRGRGGSRGGAGAGRGRGERGTFDPSVITNGNEAGKKSDVSKSEIVIETALSGQQPKRGRGVTGTRKVDYEIPRKLFHSSIGVLGLALYQLNPESTTPLLRTLLVVLTVITSTDLIRFNSPAFNAVYIKYLGKLMRREEEGGWNGTIPYLVGICWVLGFYPREVVVVGVLTLSWVDTMASIVGRWIGPKSPPLPRTILGIPMAPRKSLAGYLAAVITGFCIGVGFWWGGSDWHREKHGAGNWAVLSTRTGVGMTGLVLGFVGATVEAWGAFVWLWLTVASVIAKSW